MTDRNLSLPVLDDTCSRCAGKGTYRMRYHCSNCGNDAVIVHTKGHKTLSYSEGPECPTCGVRHWLGARLVDD